MKSVKEICFGVVVTLIATYVYNIVTNTNLWNVHIPIWMCVSIIIGIAMLYYAIRLAVTQYRIRTFISEFTECAFGDSYVYTWKYQHSRNGRYSAYGYEATDIHIKKPSSETNNRKIVMYGHDIPEETIKMFIQLIVVANIDKKMGKTLTPVLEYLHWTEDSQKHKLLH